MDNSPVNTSSGGELYEVEKIIKHKKMTNGKMIYFVKWKGYDSSNNSWEPEHNFASHKMILDYHEQRNKAKSMAKASKKVQKETFSEMDKKSDTTKIGDQTDVVDTQQTEKRQIDAKIVPSKDCEYLFEDEIDERGLIPEKVLNIFHVKNDEKNLVAHVQFKNQAEPAFVPASWANQHCPLMVIQFYENRIYWHQKSSGELVKADYAENA